MNDAPQRPATDETPRAIADLAASLRDTRPSASVARALDEAWDALHAPVAASPVTAGAARRGGTWWWGAGAAAAAAVLLAIAIGAVRGDTSSSSHEARQLAPDTAVGPPSRPAVDVPAGVRAAVPDGPIGPPPPKAGPGVPPTADRRTRPPRSPSTNPREAVRHASATPSRAELASQTALDEAGGDEPFVWLRGADEIEPGLGLQIVRVQVPRLQWDTGTPRRVLVEADLLMGFDGQPRAVRMVRTGGR